MTSSTSGIAASTGATQRGASATIVPSGSARASSVSSGCAINASPIQLGATISVFIGDSKPTA